MFIQTFSLGADPELFIINSKTGKVVSSIGLIPGVKEEPYRGEDMPEGFGLETDNILAEFNIPPCYDIQSWVNNIEYMKSYIRNFVKRVNPDYDIKCSAYELVDDDQLQSEEACQFGCDPDFNIYTMKQNPKPEAKNAKGRGAGFHIHVGYEGHNIETSLQVLKYLDAYVGLVSVLNDPDTQRRQYYGKAGSFRLQPWGFEWRPMSSAMMATPELLQVVYNQVVSAITAFNNRGSLPDSNYVQIAINNSDMKLADQLIKAYHMI